MSVFSLIGIIVVGVLGLAAVFALIVIVLARWQRQVDEDRRFQQLLVLAADFEARETLEDAWKLPTREPSR